MAHKDENKPPDHHDSPQQLSSLEQSAESSRAASPGGTREYDKPPKGKNRVRFDSRGGNTEPVARSIRPVSSASQQTNSSGRRGGVKLLPDARSMQDGIPLSQDSYFPQYADLNASLDVTESPMLSPNVRASRNFSIGPSDGSDLDEFPEDSRDDIGNLSRIMSRKTASQHTAQARAEHLSRSLRGSPVSESSHSQVTVAGSPPVSPPASPNLIPQNSAHFDMYELLERLDKRRNRFESHDDWEIADGKRRMKKSKHGPDKKGHTKHNEANPEADDSVISPTTNEGANGPKKSFFKVPRFIRNAVEHFKADELDSEPPSGVSTPNFQAKHPDGGHWQTGVLGTLMGLHNQRSSIGAYTRERLPSSTLTTPTASGTSTPMTRDAEHQDEITGPSEADRTPLASGSSTPRMKPPKWYKNEENEGSTSSLSKLIDRGSTASLNTLVGVSTMMHKPKQHRKGGDREKSKKAQRPRAKKSRSSRIEKLFHLGPQDAEGDIHIQVHIEELLSRQKYILILCRALMLYGAPTHRLEEYMRTTARVLEIQGRFLFIPGCMIISFEDASTYTSDVKIVRSDHGVNLGKLQDLYEVYKAVIHDKWGAKKGTEALQELLQTRDRYGPWTIVLFHGLASACVGPFAFQARLIDLPMCFILGVVMGFMRIIVAPRTELFSNIFEVAAAVVTSFLARAIGSVSGGNLFCFSAIAQSSIALILPGYIVLCSALELQSHNIVAGSIRMVYAIIYSLFLGFGITIGTSCLGWIYNWFGQTATSETSCQQPLESYWYFVFVPFFTFCLIIINQGKWKQMPVMVVISMAGYTVNHFLSLILKTNIQVSQTLGALTIGLLGNLYSRAFHGLSAAMLIPAIFVQVPSGLAASGSLITGLASADQIVNGTAANGTTTVSSGLEAASGIDINTTVFNVAYSIIQIAIGITVGLFLSSLVVYPCGKRRSGLFSF